MKQKIRILIADDHLIVRTGIAAILGTEKDLEVVGQAKNGLEAVSETIRLCPDIVIMDLMMPNMSGADATARIISFAPKTGIIILSSFSDSADMARAIAAGARGAQAKEAPTDALVDAVRVVAAGGTAISPEIDQLIKEDPPPTTLTEKQADILKSAARGLSNKDIAKQFGISPVSVKKHMSAIFLKLGAATRAEASAIALRKHLLKM